MGLGKKHSRETIMIHHAGIVRTDKNVILDEIPLHEYLLCYYPSQQGVVETIGMTN